MRELEWKWAYFPWLDAPDKQHESAVNAGYVKVVLKSEADNVIANLEESHKKEVEQLLIEIAKLKADYKESCGRLQTANLIKDEQLAATRHHKYKRCLNMASEWRNYAAFCSMESHCHNHRGFGKTAEKWTWKEIHAWKCVKLYKELAEKFKPNNEVNNGN